MQENRKVMATKKIDNREPMVRTRAAKREQGLRPVEMWVHTSVSKEKIKEAEKRLQAPVKEAKKR